MPGGGSPGLTGDTPMTFALAAPRFAIVAVVIDEDRGAVYYPSVDCARTYRHAAAITARLEHTDKCGDGYKVWDIEKQRFAYGDPDAPAVEYVPLSFPIAMGFDDEIPF